MSLKLALLLAGQAATVSTPAVPPQTAAGEQADAQANGRLGNQQQGGGGDVVVTARRRAETIQTVPIAMSVIGGTALAETGAYNVSRLTQLQPTLQFYSTNPRNSAAGEAMDCPARSVGSLRFGGRSRQAKK